MKPRSYGICPYRITDTTEILLMRAKGHSNWGFVKGKIEDNESVKECAVRECFEEIGISIDERYLEDFFYSTESRKNIGIFLVDSTNIDLSSPVLCDREVDELRWFKVTDVIDIQLNQKRVLTNIINKFIKRVYFFNRGHNGN